MVLKGKQFIKILIVMFFILIIGLACNTPNSTVLNKEKLRQGILDGLEFQIGADLKDIKEGLGAPEETGEYEGYNFHLHELNDFALFYLANNEGIVQHVRLYPILKMSLDQVRASLGPADVDQINAVIDDKWGLIYELDKFTLYVNGSSVDEKSFVSYLYLKQETIELE